MALSVSDRMLGPALLGLVEGVQEIATKDLKDSPR